MASGWVRIKAPSGVDVQIGVNSGNVKSISSLGKGGDAALFSAWVREASIGTDTVFYMTNHSGGDVVVPLKWMASDGSHLQDTQITIGANQMAQAPASAYI